MTGCILPWMKLMHPKTQLCEDENEALKNAINEYLCAMNHITNDLFNATEFKESCKETDALFPDCHFIRSCHEVILEKQFKYSRYDEEVSNLWLFSDIVLTSNSSHIQKHPAHPAFGQIEHFLMAQVYKPF